MAKRSADTAARQGRTPALTPLLDPTTSVDWWFLFKLNAAEEPGTVKPRGVRGPFDHEAHTRPPYEDDGKKFSQRYLFASSANPTLQHGRGILGATRADPLGATFAQVYFGACYYVLWNDQFYDDPRASAGAPWGHSKGLVAWNEDGDGFVMQVSTPSWPAAGNRQFPRQTDGNTLGFVRDDDIEVSQHFFALRLTRADLVQVLRAMVNASVVTGVSTAATWKRRPVTLQRQIKAGKAEPPQPPLPPAPWPPPPAPDRRQVINPGGPPDVQALVAALGAPPARGACTKVALSSGVVLISKPSDLHVPPWQMVSSQLGGVDLRVASWWAYPQIYSTTRKDPVPACWDKRLRKPGAVEIAVTGTWRPPGGGKTETLGLEGGSGPEYNHAKLGVSTSGGTTYAIFGDMNQQGALCEGYLRKGQPCSSSQNGRGGLFYVMDDARLHESLASLLAGTSAPTAPPSKKGKTRT